MNVYRRKPPVLYSLTGPLKMWKTQIVSKRSFEAQRQGHQQTPLILTADNICGKTTSGNFFFLFSLSLFLCNWSTSKILKTLEFSI